MFTAALRKQIYMLALLVLAAGIYRPTAADSGEHLPNVHPVVSTSSTSTNSRFDAAPDQPAVGHADKTIRLTAATFISPRTGTSANDMRRGADTAPALSRSDAVEPPLALIKAGPLTWQPIDDAPFLAAAPSFEAIDGATSAWGIGPGDQTLNTAIARWATAAGWQLVWELPVDYMVESQSTITGTFEDAIETVAKSMQSVEVPMKAIFYKKNKVVRIVARGAQ